MRYRLEETKGIVNAPCRGSREDIELASWIRGLFQ